MASLAKATGRVKSCNACRQLKLRCDAHEHNYSDCSRCRKMHRECVVTPSFRRRSRQTKADLERELDRLRAQYESPPTTAASVGQSNPTPTEHPSTDASGHDQMLATNEDTTLGGNETLFQVPRPPAVAQSVAPDESNDPQLREPDLNGYFMPSVRATRSQRTSSRPPMSDITTWTLGDVELTAQKVDGCFSTFLKHYAPTVPGIFDRTVSPSEFHVYSPFLFWTVVYVGARKYPRDPTIFESLTKPLTDLAHRSLLDPEHAIPSIQAAILLCLWHFPVNTNVQDTSHAIAGAAMQLAIQKGLNYSSQTQDFVRLPLKQLDADVQFRARLWVYCVLVFQSTGVYDGLTPMVAVEPPNSDREDFLADGLPSLILYKYRLQRIQTDAFSSILRAADFNSTKEDNILNSLVEHFDVQAQQISPTEPNDLGRFALNSLRLILRTFHFFPVPSNQRTAGVLQAYFVACDLIETAVRLDKTQEFSAYCTHLDARAVCLAAVCILRVLRSNLVAQVNAQHGEERFFEAIRLSRERSVRGNDLSARLVIILTQLWGCARLFKLRDGSTDGLRLLLRGRLSMSLLFDALWWWRAEFGGKPNPYMESEADLPFAASTTTALGQSDDAILVAGAENSEKMLNSLVDTSEVPDWNWEQLGDPNWDWY